MLLLLLSKLFVFHFNYSEAIVSAENSSLVFHLNPSVTVTSSTGNMIIEFACARWLTSVTNWSIMRVSRMEWVELPLQRACHNNVYVLKAYVTAVERLNWSLTGSHAVYGYWPSSYFPQSRSKLQWASSYVQYHWPIMHLLRNETNNIE